MKFLRPVAFAAIAIPLAFTTACGSSASPQVASLGSNTPSASADPGRSTLAYAQCMRSKGVNIDDQGNLPKAADGSMNLPANFQDANTACDAFAPQQQGSGSNADAQADNIKLANCMRTNGVKDWPDPVAGDPKPGASGGGGAMISAGGGGTSSFTLPSSINLNSPSVKKALTTCQGGTGQSFGSSASQTK